MTVARFSTFTGKCVDLFNMSPDDIDIYDIAHHLALINRFNGATNVPVSVAQHSVDVSYICSVNREIRLQGLLHDAAEAYLGDVTKWLKASPTFAVYRELEDRLQAMIFAKYGVETRQSECVTWADEIMVRIEGYGAVPMMTFGGNPKYKRVDEVEFSKMRPGVPGYLKSWSTMNWQEAKNNFLITFEFLTRK